MHKTGILVLKIKNGFAVDNLGPVSEMVSALFYVLRQYAKQKDPLDQRESLATTKEIKTMKNIPTPLRLY